MEVPRRSDRATLLLLVTICSFVGCETPPREMPVSDVVGRRAHIIAERRLAQTQPSAEARTIERIPSRMIGPTETQPAGDFADLIQQIPDPMNVLESLKTEREGEKPVSYDEGSWRKLRQAYYDDVLSRVNLIRRPTAVELSLAEAVRRTLKNSYAIQIQSYNPAIEATRIVEAEAQFDAIFFANFSYNKQDQPTGTTPVGNETDTRSYQAGVRKLLSTGMQVTVGYNMTRTANSLSTGTLNPAFADQFTIDFTQPLLRGFGLDYNRYRIDNAKLERDKSLEVLRRNIRETLFNVEQAYWRLFAARRLVVIDARVLSNLGRILYQYEQRLQAHYDVFNSQVAQIRSQIELDQAQFVRQRSLVKNAEDTLKALINDPQLNQAADIEIIPVDTPTMTPVVVDQLGELTAALNNRQELHETKLTIQQAQIQIGVAKNQALPKLDLEFRYIIEGLGTNADQAFKKLTDNDFTEWLVQLQFEWAIGNRGPEAALRQARLQQAQAIAAQRQQIEQVISEVNTAIRDLQTSYDQIGPSIRGAEASRDQLRDTLLRAPRYDAPELQVELQAHENLATQRRSLATVLADYNISLVDLERRKGTLLEYNNIVIRGTNEENYLEPYRPIGP